MLNPESKVAVHGGNPWAAARLYGGRPEDYLDFSANINPLGPPLGVIEALTKHLKAVQYYPEPEYTHLVEAIARRFDVKQEQVCVGNGATELIYRLAHLPDVRRWVIPQPTFGEYRVAAARLGQSCFEPILSLERLNCGLTGLGLSLPYGGESWFSELKDALFGELRPGDLVFLCNPNNPTGELLPKELVGSVAQQCITSGAYLVVDESFMDFVPESSESVISDLDRLPNVLVLVSLTKIYAIPGLRLGCLISSPSMVRVVRDSGPSWSVNALAAAAGAAALEDRAFVRRSQEYITRAKNQLVQWMAELGGLRVVAGAANFLFLDLQPSGFSSSHVAEQTARRKVLVRDCSSFPGLGFRYIRVAVRTPEENQRLVSVLKEVLDQKANRGEGE